jgi:tRNA nucleotidyltransferase (CCA-adding enzyme)
MPNVAHFVEKHLDPAKLRALHAAGDLVGEAPGQPHEVYMVGGPVRDMFLGRSPEDLDLSVVGDGEEFGRHLAEKLGGRLAATSEFGTARALLDCGAVDIATARFETYSGPGALPHVTPAGIQEDLARRDFTVNAMAVAVWPARWGDLLDPHGGAADTVRKQLRVLHDKSFRDDPTRIMRGLRYHARLGFEFEPRTLGLIARDRQFISSLSAARVRAELERMLAERARAEVMRSADGLGVLAAIHPALKPGPGALAALGKTPVEAEGTLYALAVLTVALAPEEAEQLVARLQPPREWREVILAAPRFRSVTDFLIAAGVPPGQVVEALDVFPLPVLLAQREVASPGLLHSRLDDYLTRLRHVQPECDGNDLVRAGVSEGPEVGVLLRELRTARLDGRVHTKDEELAMVRARLSSAARSPQP